MKTPGRPGKQTKGYLGVNRKSHVIYSVNTVFPICLYTNCKVLVREREWKARVFLLSRALSKWHLHF